MIPGPYVTADPEFNTENYQDFDERLTFFYSAFSTSNAMFLAMPGKGSQYAGAFFDADGDRPAGGTDYTLHIPADVPVANYWSLVLYDADTRCLIDNGGELSSIASNHNLTLNPDGSADLPFGPPTTRRRTGQLDPDRARPELVRRAPPLRTHPGLLRPQLDTRRHHQNHDHVTPVRLLPDRNTKPPKHSRSTWPSPLLRPSSPARAFVKRGNCHDRPDTGDRGEFHPRGERSVHEADRRGAFGRLRQVRAQARGPAPIDNQTVVRVNRDALYSGRCGRSRRGAGPPSPPPDAGARFMSLRTISRKTNTPSPSSTAPGRIPSPREQVGTRYMLVGVRTLVDPDDGGRGPRLHALQDAMKFEQKPGSGVSSFPWDAASQARCVRR